MKKYLLLGSLHAFIVCGLSLAAMEKESKSSQVPMLIELAERVAQQFYNPNHPNNQALSFLSGNHAKYLTMLSSSNSTERLCVRELAYDAVPQLEAIFSKISEELEDKEILVERGPVKISSLDKKWYAQRHTLSSIIMGNDTEKKEISIPLLPGFLAHSYVEPLAISLDNTICLTKVAYVDATNETDLQCYLLGMKYSTSALLYQRASPQIGTTDKNSFICFDEEKVVLCSLSDGLELCALQIPAYTDQSKIMLNKSGSSVFANVKNILYMCNSITGKIIRTFTQKQDIHNYCLNSNNQSVALLTNKNLSIVNVCSGNTIAQIEHNITDMNKYCSYDNDRYVITSWDDWKKGERTNFLWDIKKKQLVAKKVIPVREAMFESKAFIYPYIIQKLSLKDLITLLVVEKKWQEGANIDYELHEYLSKSDHAWLRILIPKRYALPSPLNEKQKEKYESSCTIQ